MCKSGSTIFTWPWLSPLCYSVICVNIVIMGVVLLLWFLAYLSKYLNMPRKVTSSLQSIEWFLGIQYDMTSRRTHFAVGYLATVLFFYLQDYISRGHVMYVVSMICVKFGTQLLISLSNSTKCTYTGNLDLLILSLFVCNLFLVTLIIKIKVY